MSDIEKFLKQFFDDFKKLQCDWIPGNCRKYRLTYNRYCNAVIDSLPYKKITNDEYQKVKNDEFHY